MYVNKKKKLLALKVLLGLYQPTLKQELLALGIESSKSYPLLFF